MNAPAIPHVKQSENRRLDWVSFFLTLIALSIGIVIPIVVHQLGALSLLAIPALLLFIAVVGQPDIGLASLVFVTFTQLSNVGIVYHGLPSIAQPLAGLLLILIILRITLYGEQPLGWLRAGPILVMYVVVWLVSFLNATNFAIASTAFIGIIKDVLGGVIVVFLVQRPESFRAALWSLVVTGLFLSAITTYQSLTGTFSSNYWGFGQITNQISGDISRQRISGPYSNPNAYAQILVVILPIALDRLWDEKKALPRIVAGLTSVLIVVSIFYTYSRNGFISMLFAVGLLFAQRRISLMPWILTAALIVGLIQFLPSTYTERLGTLSELISSDAQITDSSFRGRLSENLAGWRMFLDHPVLGVGLGNFRVFYQTYSREIGLDPRRAARTPANLYLELLSEQGLIGTTFFFFLMFIVLKNLVTAMRQFRLAGMHREAYMTAALVSGFAGYMFAAINKNSAYANAFWILIGIMLAVAQVAKSSLDQKAAQAKTPEGHIG